ncbi:MAG: SIS domain-containing protein [Patescibacteria group bacterium]
MRDAILSLGSQLKDGAALAKPVEGTSSRVICCGMGGSSVAGEMLSMARDNVVVHWDWELPVTATSGDLVVCTSWSGGTAETISSYDAARAAGIPVAVITTGGELGRKAQSDGVPLTILPDTKTPPRFNTGLMIGALFTMLGMTEQLPAIDATVLESAAVTLAGDVSAKTPVFYASYPWRKIAGFFKAMVNENAKRHSWSASFPSVAHNEIMGWAGNYQSTMAPIVIRDMQELPRDRKDIEAFIAIVRSMGYTVSTIGLVGASPLEKALNAYVVALWASWHMATTAGIDAAGTKWIDEFKRLKANN